MLFMCFFFKQKSDIIKDVAEIGHLHEKLNIFMTNNTLKKMCKSATWRTVTNENKDICH